jgi:hypothetical protein
LNITTAGTVTAIETFANMIVAAIANTIIGTETAISVIFR